MKLLEKYQNSINTAVIIMTLAWPTIVEQVMQTAVQYIDTAMVGTLGTQATAAVGATSTINWLVMGTITAISIGFLSYIARACGANDKKMAQKYVAQSGGRNAPCDADRNILCYGFRTYQKSACV